MAALVLGLWSVDGTAQTAWTVGASGDSWADAVDRWIALDDTTKLGAVQPVQIPQGWSVVRDPASPGFTTERRNLFGYRWAYTKGPLLIEADTLEIGWHPRMWQAGRTNANAVQSMRGLIDGQSQVAGFTHAYNRDDGLPNGVTFFTFDLGVPVPVDSVVFYPPQSGRTSDNERQREQFPYNYEVSRTNTPVEWLIYEDENNSTGSSGYHPLADILGTTFANNQSVVSLTGDLAFTRFLRFRFGEEYRTILVAEIEVYGRGYPQEARYISESHSFGERVSLGKVEWGFTKYRQVPSGEIVEDPSAPVELVLRTRAGSDDDPTAYYIYDDLGRELQVDAADYYAAPRVTLQVLDGVADFRAQRADDTENWNNWSVPYVHSGDQNRSSDGNEFLQFRFEITTEDPMTFGVLDSVAFEVSPLLADSAVAEISLEDVPVPGGLVEVPLGVDTTFVYDIRTVSGAQRTGFDGIELDVPAGARFLDLEIDGQLAAAGTDYEVVESPGRLQLSFPQVVRADRSYRVRFRSALFQSSVFLAGRLVNSDPTVTVLPQSIEPGDARHDVASDDVQVVAQDTDYNLLPGITLSTKVITPNGDNANDEALIDFDLYGIEGGDLTVEIFDLAGRRVRDVLSGVAGSGHFGPPWDGRDGDGRLVAPGIYLVRVEVQADVGTLTRVQPVAVAY